MTSRPRKRFAQHWLQSEKALNQILDAAHLDSSDSILEIGPGTGILTRRLLPEVSSVIAVELDRDLCKKLVKKFKDASNFLLLQGDILTLDLMGHLQSFPQFRPPNKVVANIPYNITGPILDTLLGTLSAPAQPPYQRIVLLMQKEVADRICGQPGSKIFGALSVRVQYLAACDYIATVPAKAFYPRPKVDSAIISLSPRSFAAVCDNPKQLETLVKLGFANKRKMLRNNLKSVIESDRLCHYLEQLQINPQSRAEDLSVEDWVALSNAITTQALISSENAILYSHCPGQN